MSVVKLPENRPFDVVTFGYNSVDYLCSLPNFPARGQKVVISEFTRQGGGQAATAAVALRRFGFNVRYVGKFGGDQSGRFSLESIRNEGVDVHATAAAEGVINQTAFIWIEEGTGERTIAYRRMPELDFEVEELDREAICSGRVLLVDAHQIEATTQAAAWAKEAGMVVIVDAERNLPGVDKLLGYCDYILCDTKFPYDYTGSNDPETALKSLAGVDRMAAMTFGEGGSLAYADGKLISTPGYKVKAVDTTGAGDVFHAGFVAGLLMELELEQVLRLANAAAALKCRKLGGREGIPTRREMMKLAGI